MRKLLLPPIIRCDSQGNGHYGAARGTRTHKGIDYVCEPGSVVYSPCDGLVTKHGTCYQDCQDFTYIEVRDDSGNRHRLFYTVPLSHVNELVAKGQIIASCQNIADRYEGMTPHMHYEVINSHDEHINPEG